jgi:UPF0755 protein
MGRLAVRLILLIAVAAAASLAAYAWAVARLNAPGPLTEDVTLILPKGSGVSVIARHLGKADVLADPLLFVLAARLAGADRRLRAGEYRFSAGASAMAVIDQLRRGETVVRRFTVAEGLTTRQVLDLTAAAEGMAGEVPADLPEGALLPETYHYSYGDTRAELVARMRQAMEASLGELWPERSPGLPFDTPREALILASIVEKETSVAGERPHIAGVFINRLERGMRLQSDPTVAYGIAAADGPLDRPLTRADLARPTPFNTYLITGLPPQPIANPGRAAIAAVMQPLETRDLYFVANGSGGHAFARTLAEHNRNVRKWRRLREQSK